jgi:hypothetical protein
VDAANGGFYGLEVPQETTKPPVGGFVPTAADPYGPQFASAGTIPVAVTVKVFGVAMVNFT